ncbi:MAG: nucleosidase [Pseudomonadota bacterium]
MKPLLVFAMKEEAQDVFDGFDVLSTGIGQVNAAYTLTKAIETSRPEIVINLGTAGSRKHKGGSIVNPTEFIQRDMDVTVLGFEKFQTPFSDDPKILKYGQNFEGLQNGVCGTGDNFDASEDAKAFDVVDMEGYALALICARENIPFACLKYVSDGADDGANEDWNDALNRAAHALKAALEGANL